MAGEWLKFESNLPEKPETLAITLAMGWDDPDLTVGKLMRLFRWFDQQTISGNAPSVTPALLDRIIGVSGFVQAVADVGWIVIEPRSMALNNFDRHNGATAKSRAQTAKRVAKHKGNAEGNGEGNAPTVSEALPREEKRREEKKEAKASTVVAFAPPEWVPSVQWAAFVKMRKAMRNIPFTDDAAEGVVASLSKLCAVGHDAADLLQEAVTNGWRTVYPPKNGGSTFQPINKQEALEQRNQRVVDEWANGGVIDAAT